jgi:DNA-3-methyladenine glycosylase
MLDNRLSTHFFARPVQQVARELLGMHLTYGACVGQIIETEAYHQDEPACHAWQAKKTPRNQMMFAAPGTLYIYRIHQVFCLNLVAEQEGIAAAVLIRALWPLQGLALMTERRNHPRTGLCDGPGKLCQALGINLTHNGGSVCAEQAAITISDQGTRYLPEQVFATPRIGISRARELCWRFVISPPFDRIS